MVPFHTSQMEPRLMTAYIPIEAVIDALDEASDDLAEYLDDASAGDVPEDGRIASAAELVEFALKHLRRKYLQGVGE